MRAVPSCRTAIRAIPARVYVLPCWSVSNHTPWPLKDETVSSATDDPKPWCELEGLPTSDAFATT
jgi:hypothetical protein